MRSRSARDALLHVRDGRRVDHLHRLELRVADPLEQPLARREDHRDDVQVQLVEQVRREVLLHGARAAGDRDVLAAGGRTRSLERRVDAIGDSPSGWSTLGLGPATKPSRETEMCR